MNVLLWILQGLLALLLLAGGAYKVSSAAALAGQFPLLGAPGWRALGVVEIAGAALLVLPAATRFMPVLTPLAAAVVAVEALALAGVYGRYSLQIAATNPLVWSVGMGLVATFVAYGRHALHPLG